MQARRGLYMNATCSMGIWRCPAYVETQCKRQTCLLYSYYSTCGVNPQKKNCIAKKNPHLSEPQPTSHIPNLCRQILLRPLALVNINFQQRRLLMVTLRWNERRRN